MGRSELSIDTLHSLLICDPNTGALTWRTRGPEWFKDGRDSAAKNAAKWNARFAGKPAICSRFGSHGYLDGAILGVGVLAHRVVWAMTHGRWPVGVDHINGDRTDNRPANLREADQAANMKNTKVRSDSPTGAAGVWRLRGSGLWRARIKSGGVSHDLGAFETKAAAVAARRDAMQRLGFHLNHGRAA